MKNFYYFSNTKLKFVEIRNFYKKFVFLIIFFSLLSSFLLFGGYFVIKQIVNPDRELTELKTENYQMRIKLEEYGKNFKDFEEQLTQLAETNNQLRLATNLQTISPEEREVGTGGSIFENFDPGSSSDVKSLIETLDSYSEKISLKMDFEIANYAEIKSSLESNIKLFESIPAIKPTSGAIGDRFGMRLHPILRIVRMHEGVDILADNGTPVYSPGAGTVDFVGYRGGYGLTVEIDHGFGYRTLYAHLKKALVKKGAKLKRGDEIALTGQSGQLATGPHLHYEVSHNGITLNPRNFIYDDVNLFDVAEAVNEGEK